MPNKYIILNYSKNIGHTQTKISHPKKTIRGNVVLTVPEYFISRFNVPIFTEETPVTTTVRKTFRRLKSGKIAERPEHHKMSRKIKRGKSISITKKMEGFITANRQPVYERHNLIFPRFFNFWMIDNAVYQILEYAPDFEKLRFSVDGGGSKEPVGEETGYGSVKLSGLLIKGDTPHHNNWGETSFMALAKTL